MTDHYPSAGEGVGSLAEGFALAKAGDAVALARLGTQPFEGANGGRTADAVGGEPRVALEVVQRGGGVDTEDAVDPARIEPQRPQPALEGGDVVAAQRWRAVIEEPVTEGVAGFDENAPRLGPADAVDP